MKGKNFTKESKELIKEGLHNLSQDKYPMAKECFKNVAEALESRLATHSHNFRVGGRFRKYMSIAAFGGGLTDGAEAYEKNNLKKKINLVIPSVSETAHLSKNLYESFLKIGNCSPTSEQYYNFGKYYGLLSLKNEGIEIIEFTINSDSLDTPLFRAMMESRSMIKKS